MWSSAEQAYWKELSAARPFAPGSWYAPSGMLPLFRALLHHNGTILLARGHQ